MKPKAAASKQAAAGANPPDDGPLKIWNDVPDRSTLELRLDSTDQGFAGTVRFVSDDGRVETWPDSDIHPGPKRRLLSQTAQGYVGTLFVAFDSQDTITANVRARILDPTGNVFATGYFHAITGKRGDIKAATLLISMVQP
jgi:hypothetical protein